MGGFVQNKGWLELGTYGSNKLKVKLFNINNAAKSSSVKQQEADFPAEMKDVGEFELTLRTMRLAAQFAAPWNYSFLALENFLYQKKFVKDELQNDENPARTLCQFSNFILGENANHWRDGKGFLTPNDLSGYWSSFVGARPQVKLTPPQPAVHPKPQKAEPQKAQGRRGNILSWIFVASTTWATVRHRRARASTSVVSCCATYVIGEILMCLTLRHVGGLT